MAKVASTFTITIELRDDGILMVSTTGAVTGNWMRRQLSRTVLTRMATILERSVNNGLVRKERPITSWVKMAENIAIQRGDTHRQGGME